MDFLSRDLKLYFGARFLSTIAIQIQSVAIGWQIFATTGNVLDLGLVGLAQFLPLAALSMVAGETADRFDRRRIMIGVQASLGGCAVLLFLAAGDSAPDLSAIYGILVLFGTARAFGGPAAQSFVPLLVEPGQFSRAVAWNSGIWQVGTIAGPALGGVLYATVAKPGHVYLVSAVLFLVSVLLLIALRIRVRPVPTESASWRRLTAGIQYVWSNKLLLGAISLDLFAVLLGGSVALLPVFAKSILDVGPPGLGLLRAAPGTGAALMALVLVRRPLVRRVGVKMLSCVAIFGVATIVLALSRSFLLSLVALLVLGAADMVSVVTRHMLVQMTTPPPMRGRVSAVSLVFIGASNELGEFESGVTSRFLGTVPAVLVGGAGTLAIVGIWSWLFPSLRKVDRIEPPSEEPSSARS